MRREKVILRRCPDYNPEAIAGIIREGIEEFGLAPRLRGRSRALTKLLPHLLMLKSMNSVESFLKIFGRLFHN